MALVIADRVRETTTTTGTGTITLAGAVTNFETFTANLSNSDTTYYSIVDNTNGAFEVGLGTFTASGTTLARTTIIASSNSNSAVDFGAGTKDVFITIPASKMIVKDTNGNVSIDGDVTVADGSNDFDVASHDGTNGLKLGGTLVTSSASELNILTGKSFVDEDNMASNSADHVPTQQSVKAYVDANSGANTSGSNNQLLTDDGSGGITSEGSLTFDGTSLQLSNNKILSLGDDDDIKLYHNSSSGNANIENYTGSLYVTNYTDDGDIFFRVDDGGSNVITALQIDASDAGTATFNHDILLNKELSAIRFGASQQGSIYEHASDIVVSNSAAGNDTIFENLNSAGDTYVKNLFIDGSTSRVGIGTNSPGAFLDVHKDNDNSGNQFRVADTEGGSAAVRTYSTSDGTGLIINHYYAVGGSPYMRYSDFVSSMGDAAATTMRFLTKPASANPAVAMVINNSQNVGIGTDSPATKLHLMSGDLFLTANSTSANSGQGIFWQSTTSGWNTGQALGAIYGRRVDASNGYLRFDTRSSGTTAERMRLTEYGRLGIGTDTPSYKLDINGSTRIVGDSEEVLRFQNGSTSNVQSIEMDSSRFYFYNRTAGAFNSIAVLNSGSVGIGTTSPAGKLHIDQSLDNTLIVSDNPHSTTNATSGISFGGHSNGNTYIDTKTHTGGLLIGRIGEGTEQGYTRTWLQVDATNSNVTFGGQLNIGGALTGVTGLYGASSTLTLYNNTYNFKNASSGDMMSLTSTGLGIGTTSPDERLSVVSGSSNRTAHFGRYADNGLFLHSEAAADDSHKNWIIQTQENIDGGLEITPSASNGGYDWVSAGGLAIKSDGHVGIGTNAPGYILHTHDGSADSRHKVSTSSHGTYFESGVSSDSAGIILVAGHNSSILNIYLQNSGGSASNEFQFQHDGDFHADGDVVAFSTTVSDKRLKDNVKTIDSALNKVMKLRGVEFDWNQGKRKGQHDLGLIAQEVEEVLPELVREKTLCTGEYEGNEQEFKTVDYEKIVGVLIEAVKEQQEQINKLEEKLNG